MKKLLLTLVVLLAISFQGFSQNKLIIPEVQYEAMKAKGQLQPGVTYVTVPDVHPKPIVQKALTQGQHPKMSSAGCSCYVTPDATYTLAMAPNDDGSTGVITIPFNFCLYGTNYTSLYINNNGNISFGSPYVTFSSFPFPDPGYVMVAPFWGDVDTRGTGTVKYKLTSSSLTVNWDHVGYYSYYTDKLNSFQLIITDGTDPVLPTGNNIAFCYGDMQWTTGDASGGNATGFGGTPATVGINQGGAAGNYIQMGRFDQPGLAYDGGYGNNDGVSWLDNQSMYFNVCNATNIAPIASGLNNCDTIKICGSGDTLYLNGLFLAPEIGQITNISVNLSGTPNASIISNTSGNSADAIVMIIASGANAGNNHIIFTATDNGIPVGTTTIDVNVFVDTTGISNFNPVINGNLEFCEGGNSVLTVSPITYDSYVWSTGAFGTTITVDTTGIYYVTASLNGCYKSTSVNIIDNPLPTPNITGATFTCNGNPTIIYLDSSYLYTSYSWSTGSTNDSLTTPGGGPYIITVTDSNGCIGASPPLTVVPQIPVVTIPWNHQFCPGDTLQLTAFPNPSSGVDFLWSTNAITQTEVVNAAGVYTVHIHYPLNGCDTSTSVTVALFNAPVANFSANPISPYSPLLPISFTDLSTPLGVINNWQWDFGDGTTSTLRNPYHTYAVNGQYTVTLIVTDSVTGCSDSVQFPYEIVSDILVPNVFTPNNPGPKNENQYFYFENLKYFPGSKLLVYNRWGNKVYENADYQNDWNGGTHPDGVYYYVLDGPLFKEPKYGFVQLLR